MPLRGTLSGVAPSPLVSRSVLPDAPRQLIRTFGAGKGAGAAKGIKKALGKPGAFCVRKGLFFVRHHITGNGNKNDHKDDTNSSDVHL